MVPLSAGLVWLDGPFKELYSPCVVVFHRMPPTVISSRSWQRETFNKKLRFSKQNLVFLNKEKFSKLNLGFSCKIMVVLIKFEVFLNMVKFSKTK